MKWFAEAPSNIALIKYMGRAEGLNEEKKIPANPSLSYTLPNLKSYVEIELMDSRLRGNDEISYWEPLIYKDAQPISLSSTAQQRFLKHFEFMLNALNYPSTSKSTFILRSCNNFPLGVGLASSASSFAALSLAASKAVCALTDQPEPSLETIAQLSRLGSGSSCRSFYEPWALWESELVSAPYYPHYSHLMHQVVIIDAEEKSVSSSQAHQLVKTSPLYADRPTRATQRLHALIHALKNKQWEEIYHITWDEFQDMHQLFETASPAFTYRNDASQILLKKLQTYWGKKGDGPLITMDAGPNIHLLYRPDQEETQQEIQHSLLSGYDYVFST